MHPSQLQSLFIRVALAALLISPFTSKIAGQNLSSAAARPNLAPRDINLSSYSARPGDLIEISFTLTNSGGGDCPPSFTGFHIGQSPSVRPVNDPLNLVFSTPGISANSSLRQTVPITIPFNLPLCTHYLWVVADDDPNSSVNQTTRADDVTRSSALAVVTVLQQPNLVPQNVTLSASAARPGDPIAIMWTLANLANVTCPISLTGFHLGTSSTSPSTNDVLNLPFETPEIPANSAIRFTNFVTIPTNTTLATYYVWVVADDVPASTLNQSSRTDDVARSPALSVVSIITRPNLIPQDVKLSSYQVRPGNQLTVTWAITNSGNGNCPASITGLHLGTSASSPPATDTLNRKIATPAISTNSFVRQTNVITIPAGTALGNYYLWVVADDTNNSTLNQTSRADDAMRSAVLAVVSVIRQPNLVATNVILSSQFARPGDQVIAIWTLTNSGNANSPASQTGMKLGASATVRPTNSLLNISIPTPEIRTNSFLRQTNVFTVPTNTPLGTNYIWVIADDVANSTLDQSSKADDAAVSGPLTIVSALPRPNLFPVNIALSTYSARPGDQLTVTWAMTNSGNGNCPASLTGLRLGPSSAVRPSDELLTVFVQTPGINANSSVHQTNTVTIPANTATGTYYLWVIADDVINSTLNQTSRADDAVPSAALTIARVVLISPTNSATADAPPTFEWNAQGLVNGKIYLSARPFPVFGVDKVVFLENPSGTNKFKPAATTWITTVTNLGLAQSYFWTIGGADLTRREIYAEWSAFKTLPIPMSGTVGLTANGQFRFQIAAPNHSQVVIEASETLTHNWAQTATIPNTTGTVTYIDPTATNKAKRFFRARP